MDTAGCLLANSSSLWPIASSTWSRRNWVLGWVLNDSVNKGLSGASVRNCCSTATKP